MTPEEEKRSKDAFKELIMLRARQSGKLPSQILEEMKYEILAQQMPQDKQEDTSQSKR